MQTWTNSMAGISRETKSVSATGSQSANPRERVRGRRGRPTFLLVMAFFLAVSSLQSTKGGQSSSEPGSSGVRNKMETASHHPHHNEHLSSSSLKSGLSEAEKGEKGKVYLPNSEETAHGKGISKEHSTETSEQTADTTTVETNTVAPSSTESTEKSRNETEGTTTTPEPEDCVPPAIEQFPRPMLGQNIRKHGGFILYLLIAAYTFLALAIVCDEFFVPSLDILCELLKISPDVAGATFMAAGSSAPELATALIGVFVAKEVTTGDDIGVSGVIGSAVFNIMFVIGLCSLLTPTVLYLNWWPVFRDCFFYMISILALLVSILDEEIEWYESVGFLLLYLLYCYAMYMNTVLEAWAHTLPVPFPVVHAPVPDENSGLVTYKSAPKSDHGATASAVGGENIIVEGLDPTLSGTGMRDPYGQDAWDDGVTAGAGVRADSQIPSAESGYNTEAGGLDPPKKVAPQAESILSNLNPPPDSSMVKKVLWKIASPLVYLFYYTVPDCRLEAWRSWYIVTFIVSMVWIAIFSYVMVWMITVVGFTAGMPDTVMGLTFVAAGVSVPDALSSLAVVKEGFGDMAVSNAIGSNVFDILICLGLPWFLSSVIVHPGTPVKVISKGLVYSTFSLLSTVAFLLLATHYNGWKLDKRYGILLMLWYLFFMVFASLYELNVFGKFNPPECYSAY